MKRLILLILLSFLPVSPAWAAYILPFTVQTASGPKAYQVELAETEQEHKRGLMFRDKLADNGGMLFVYTRPQPAYMWMKNTEIPLDMLFIDDGNRIVAMIENAEPFDETPVGTAKPVTVAVELQGGAIRRDGLKIGDKVDYPSPIGGS